MKAKFSLWFWMAHITNRAFILFIVKDPWEGRNEKWLASFGWRLQGCKQKLLQLWHAAQQHCTSLTPEINELIFLTPQWASVTTETCNWCIDAFRIAILVQLMYWCIWNCNSGAIDVLMHSELQFWCNWCIDAFGIAILVQLMYWCIWNCNSGAIDVLMHLNCNSGSIDVLMHLELQFWCNWCIDAFGIAILVQLMYWYILNCNSGAIDVLIHFELQFWYIQICKCYLLISIFQLIQILFIQLNNLLLVICCVNLYAFKTSCITFVIINNLYYIGYKHFNLYFII